MQYTKDNPLRVATLCSGYDSQCLALDQLKELFPPFDYKLVLWSEFDPESKAPIDKQPAVIAHKALFPDSADLNYGDMTKIDWEKAPDVDLLFYSTPCLTADSLILTKEGYKKIIDIRVGDVVLTKSGEWHQVAKKFNNGTHPTCFIKGMGFDTIHCTPNHKFWVRRMTRRWDSKTRRYYREFSAPEFVETKDLDRSCYFGMPMDTSAEMPKWNGISLHRGTHWDKENKLSALFEIPAFWYVMGRYVGDGWQRNDPNHRGILICTSKKKEKALVEALVTLGLAYSKTKESTVIKYTIYSKELCEFVKRYGKYAYGKRIDGETMLLPKPLLKYFLGGVIESDGCYTNNKYKIATVSRELAYGYAFCIAKVYGRHWNYDMAKRKPFCFIQGRKVNQRDSYSVCFTPTPRKQDQAFAEDGYIWYPFRERIDGEVENVYNIEVEEDHSYIVQGCISKNCTDFSNAGLQKGGDEGSGTRSSVLWFTRNAILAKRPKYLIMENVKALVSDKFVKTFRKWEQELASYGYSNYCKVLNAKDNGYPTPIPQNRERIFCVSILNEDQHFHFPEDTELKLRLRDMLEEKVDEKYYLSDDKVQSFVEHCDRKQAEGCGFKFDPTEGGDEPRP